ncbi:MAG: sigma-54 dependent transcriptional regulator [Candidatus Thiodiazotropha sp.]
MISALAKEEEHPEAGMDTALTILVTEDDPRMRDLVAQVLSSIDKPVEVIAAESGNDAMDYMENHRVSVVVTDLKMPGVSGMDILKFAKQCDPMTQVIMVTGFATVESAIEALKAGAFDYIRKPFENVELCCTVERALEHCQLSRENRRLLEENQRFVEGSGLVGQSVAMQQVRRMISATSGYGCPVLISGPSGSGKEVVAHQIHAQSQRRDKEFVAINCAAIPEHLIESELFGYKKGAFTGAERSKLGLFQVADGGTIFLDEINNASLSLQAKLLRVAQDGTFYPMGDTEARTVDVRVLAASNRSMKELIETGEFREDLYYRLAVVELEVPPLNERRDDIPMLVYFFINRFSKQLDKAIKGITTAALGALMRHDWPGNIRELENVIQRMMILTESDKIDADVLPLKMSTSKAVGGKALDHLPPQSLEDVEAFFIRKTLRETKGDRTLSAEILGIDKSTLWRKIKRYNLDA